MARFIDLGLFSLHLLMFDLISLIIDYWHIILSRGSFVRLVI